MVLCAGTYQHLISERADIDEVHAGVWWGWRVGHVQSWRVCLVVCPSTRSHPESKGSQLFIKVSPCGAIHQVSLSSNPRRRHYLRF